MDFDADDDGSDHDKAAPPRFKDFDCPVCNANNPVDDGFTVGEDVHCFYCGSDFRVRATGTGRLRLREL